jgi:adenosylcobinamide-GDP ribazoletransferase
MQGANPFLLLVAATTFLTRIPIGRWIDVDGRAVAAAALLYPLVGAGIGVVGGLVADVLAGPLAALAAAAIAVGAVTVVTGAMHVDALADTADALAGRARERRLEIMRDHAVGAFGATAIALALVTQVALVAELAADGKALVSWAAAAAAARWAALPLAAALPYARADGQGRALSRSGLLAVLGGFVVAAAVGLAAQGVDGLWALAAATTAATILGGFFRSWVGGITGDCLGATTMLAELAALAALVAAG